MWSRGYFEQLYFSSTLLLFFIGVTDLVSFGQLDPRLKSKSYSSVLRLILQREEQIVCCTQAFPLRSGLQTYLLSKIPANSLANPPTNLCFRSWDLSICATFEQKESEHL